MPLGPDISNFGDESHEPGELALTIQGGGFGAFPGGAWIYENDDRTGNADELVVGTWNDLELGSVSIPESLNNTAGTRFLFVQHENLAWSPPYTFTLESVAVASTAKGGRSRARRGLRPLRELVEIGGQFFDASNIKGIAQAKQALAEFQAQERAEQEAEAARNRLIERLAPNVRESLQL